MTDEPNPQTDDEASLPASEAPAPEPSLGAGARWGPAIAALLALYVLCLAVLTLDELFSWGWFPKELEKRVNHHAAQLATPDAAARQDAREYLMEAEPFVVIPALLRHLDSASLEQRKGAADILRELTGEYLDESLLGYNPGAPSDQREQAKRRLLEWWEQAEDEF